MDKNEAFEDQTGVITLLWGPRERPSRGPKPALSVERIAHAAIEIADAEGPAAVSMQRIAGDLGFTKMSLYRYVPGKAELIALMIDTAIGEPPDLDGVPDGWRAKLQSWAWHIWEVYQRHPWLLGAIVGNRVFGPNELGWMESAVAALDGTGLDGGERLDAVLVVNGHIRNIAQQTVTTAGTTMQHAEQATASTLTRLLRQHGDRYPALTAAIASAAANSSQDQGLEFGLRRILDGLAMLITDRST
ncbi:TetR/AcrR family transcriptional regulator [Nonomuraea sp. NPDC049152]|uniref:TetR/AcrR family transcriptional regulator n=1 Tax=Nonomuraea sp. NPDC049152 TaxID=3154350 RepID=UPI0033C10A93